MTTHEIDLYCSAPPLSLNDRMHWAKKAKVTAQIKSEVMLLAKLNGLPRNAAHVTVQLHYAPRDNRRRDTDNLVATLKPICDALTAGTSTHPGYGLVPDDTPQWMAKPEPRIHPKTSTGVGRMWLELDVKETA